MSLKEKNKDTLLCEYLEKYCKGQENAVSSKTLEAVFYLKNRDIRYIINRLRSNGKAICSDQKGYYYAETKDDVNRTISQLNNRIVKITKAKNGLENSLHQSNIKE